MAGDRRSSSGKLTAGRSPQALVEGPGLEELRKALAVLEAVVSDRAILAQLPEEERTRLLVAAGRSVHPDIQQKRRLVRSLRSAERRRAEARDRAVLAQTGIRSARQADVFIAPPKALEPGEPEVVREVSTPKKCYVCKAEYRRVHSFYDALCPPCAELNYQKRFQTADLRGKVALVTGARVKIGYQAALKLLRAGAQVVATTRFPHDAAGRYASEPDFADWKDRLQVHGLDLRHSPSVEIFCSLIDRDLGRLDLLVNNACADGAAAARLLHAPAGARGALRRGAAGRAQAARGPPPRVRAAARRGRRRPAPRSPARRGRGRRRGRRRSRGLARRRSRAGPAPLGPPLADRLRLRRVRAPRGPLPRRRRRRRSPAGRPSRAQLVAAEAGRGRARPR